MASASERLERLAAAYPRRRLRSDLTAVEELLVRVGGIRPGRTVAVVGTNGKTSTATYLARLLKGGGLRVGLTVSPHLRSWSERVAVDEGEVGEPELADRVEALAAHATGLDVRFFDLLTVAAAQMFSAAETDVSIFEAGIGGRLDPVSVLRPELVVLTGIGLDHTELLGTDEASILREKLGVAPAGSEVVSARLGPELEKLATDIAVEGAFQLDVQSTAAGSFLEQNALLARAAAARLGSVGPPRELGVVRGRAERLLVAGVEVVLDAAHNEHAWRALAPELPSRFVAVVSVSKDKRAAGLAPVLAHATEVIATTAWPGRSVAACELADVVGGSPVEDPVEATRAGLDRARALGVPLVVVGSLYLLRHAYDALEASERPRSL